MKRDTGVRDEGKVRGQATTEVVLLFPVFLIILVMLTKAFALLVLIQKMEIASYYAARRWQLESHRNVKYISWDVETLRPDIEKIVRRYLGFGTPTENFLNLDSSGTSPLIAVSRTQVWNIVALTVKTKPSGWLFCKVSKQDVCQAYGWSCEKGYEYLCEKGGKFEVIKYVPNRDRPIQYELPGLSE